MCRLFGHIAFLIMLFVMPVACGEFVELPDIPETPSSGSFVNLSFSVVASDVSDNVRSRAVVTTPDGDNYFEREAGKYEKLHTLRVIILRSAGDGTKVVEHNHLVAFSDDGAIISDKLEYPVRGGEIKTVYLIANEAAIDYDFDRFSEGTVYPAGAFEAITIAPKADNGGLLFNNSEASSTKTYIPMGEVYDFYVPVPEKVGKEFSAGTLFVTRAAVKFSFSVTARAGENLRLKSIMFNGLADCEYFLPRNTVYSPAKNIPGIPNQETGQTGRFITAYSVPAAASHSPFTFNFSEAIPLSDKEQEILPSFYFCESRLKASSSAGTSGDESPYSVSITLVDADNTYELFFESIPLPNLPILPRNTHVRVNISLTEADAECVADVRPYSEVILEPDFGL